MFKYIQVSFLSLLLVQMFGYFMGHKVHDFHLVRGQVPNLQKVKNRCIFLTVSPSAQRPPYALTHSFIQQGFSEFCPGAGVSALRELTL